MRHFTIVPLFFLTIKMQNVLMSPKPKDSHLILLRGFLDIMAPHPISKKGDSMKKFLMIAALTTAACSFAADGAALYKPCIACHGAKAEKKALNKSHIIQGWEVDKTVAALKGYKDGSYGGAMKGVMKGQVAKLSDEDMKAVAEYIHGLK